MYVLILNYFQKTCYLNQTMPLGLQIKGQNDGHHIFAPFKINQKFQNAILFSFNKYVYNFQKSLIKQHL